jgi:hypothetical protein
MSHHSSRRSRGFPILGFCGVLLLTAGIGAVAQSTTCFNCNCYFASDCKCTDPLRPPPACSYSSGCKVWTTGGKAVDGTCVFPAPASSISAAETGLAAQALDLWLQAYEHAAWRGGEPDAALVARAGAVALTPDQHDAIRRTALDTEARIHGLGGSPERRGAFLMPAPTALCSSSPAPPAAPTTTSAVPANGLLQRVGPDALGVARIVREAMVSELLSPYHSNFDQVMDRIPKEFPGYEVKGTCELAAFSAGHFPYQTSLDCLKQETLAIVHVLLAPGGGPRGGAVKK